MQRPPRDVFTVTIHSNSTAMKFKRIQITVTELENGHIILGYSDGLYFIKNENGIFRYTRNEVKEIYHFDPINL